MKNILGVLVFVFSITGYAKPISIMAYNAENLFDTQHDQGTEDYTYLPLATKRSMPGHAAYCASMPEGPYKKDCQTIDWTEDLYRRKIANLGEVITSFDERGVGPDVLVLEEVENMNTLRGMVLWGLSGLGYKQLVLIEGDDSRGIDVGVISKFPVVAAKRHAIYMNGRKLNTRGILEVTLNVRGKKVVVYANHWPSQNNPASERLVHAQKLSQLSNSVRADFIVAVGDFNTVDKDAPHPFSALPNMIDSEEAARSLGIPLNAGTHFYKNEWASLDKIFVHKNSTSMPNWKTFQIVRRPWMMDIYGGPKRFNKKTGEGFSDHLPISLKVEMDNSYYARTAR